MIRFEDITVVLQGDIRAETLDAIASVREHLQGARLVLSTFVHPAQETLRNLVDDLVINEDPGALPPTILSNAAPENNINRQIVSTCAGLARVTTPYALKLRSDALLTGSNFIAIYELYACDGGGRLVVSSYYTRHPHGISGYLFHVSDWFMFGATDGLREYWSVPPMTLEDATWYERNAHAPGATVTARRFRARLAQEQHLAVAYAARRGYSTPRYLYERTPDLVSAYERFLANEFVIAEPRDLGFVLPKHACVERSLYQRIDCVGRRDWLSMRFGRSVALSPVARRTQMDFLRVAARALRHVIAYGLLARKRLSADFARCRAFLLN